MTIASISAASRANPGFELQIAPQGPDVRETTDAYVAPGSTRPLPSPSDFDVPPHWRRYAQVSEQPFEDADYQLLEEYLQHLGLSTASPIPEIDDISMILNALRARSPVDGNLALRTALALLNRLQPPVEIHLTARIIVNALKQGETKVSSPVDAVFAILPESLRTQLAQQPWDILQHDEFRGHISPPTFEQQVAAYWLREQQWDAKNLVIGLALEEHRRSPKIKTLPDAEQKSKAIDDYRTQLETETLPRPTMIVRGRGKTIPEDREGSIYLLRYYAQLLEAARLYPSTQSVLDGIVAHEGQKMTNWGYTPPQYSAANIHSLLYILTQVETELRILRYRAFGTPESEEWYRLRLSSGYDYLVGMIRRHPDSWLKELENPMTHTEFARAVLPFGPEVGLTDTQQRTARPDLASALQRFARAEAEQRANAEQERREWERRARR